MHHLNHVHRRGAVYVWRRRIPANQYDKPSYIQVSLRTRELSTAKILANLFNCAFCASILEVKTQKITRAEAQQFLTAIVSSELERIEAERYAEPEASTPQEWRVRYLDERARSVALLKLATMGPAAQLFQEDRAELLLDGFDETSIQLVETQISEMVDTHGEGFHCGTVKLATAFLNREDFAQEDVRALSSIRLTGQATALARCDRRKQTTPFIDLEPLASVYTPPLTDALLSVKRRSEPD